MVARASTPTPTPGKPQANPEVTTAWKVTELCRVVLPPVYEYSEPRIAFDVVMTLSEFQRRTGYGRAAMRRLRSLGLRPVLIAGRR